MVIYGITASNSKLAGNFRRFAGFYDHHYLGHGNYRGSHDFLRRRMREVVCGSLPLANPRFLWQIGT